MTNLLDKRLALIYDMIDVQKIVDVGSDHGKLAVQLLLNKKITNAILTDISNQSLTKAVLLAKQYNLQDNCEFLVGDGLTVLSCDHSEYQGVIAGLGGNQIVKILSCKSRIDNITNFVLQPMKNVTTLRQWLVDNDYKIICDVMTKQSKKFYNVIKVCKGKDQLTNQELLFGRTNLKNPSQDFVNYLEEEIYKFSIIKDNPKCKDVKVIDYYDKVQQVLLQIKGETQC